jgi:hypothetical protein
MKNQNGNLARLICGDGAMGAVKYGDRNKWKIEKSHEAVILASLAPFGRKIQFFECKNRSIFKLKRSIKVSKIICEADGTSSFLS